MEQKQYWQSFGELNNLTANQIGADDNEFQEDLPIEADDKGLLEAKTPRRDFLKYLGFSTAAAAAAASCETPVRKAIPFVNKPAEVTPGFANYYATTYIQDGDVVPVIAKVRDGRPIKIEGNEMSPVTRGATSARVQASVLDLYDNARLRFPTANGKEVSTFEALDRMVGSDLASLRGAPVVLLTSSITSPTSRDVIGQFLAKYPGSRHVTYDAVSYSGMLQANEASYGKRAIPSYKFDAAKVIVSLSADFLGTWVSPVEFAKQYGRTRKINEKNPEMSRHIQFESMMSLTGACADERYHHRPSETGAIAVALYAALGGTGVTAGTISDNARKGVEKTAKVLLANRGAGLVVCGSNDVNIQTVVNGINELIGAGGTTIDWSSTYNTRQGIDADMVRLVNDMNAGAIGGLIVYGANPAYTYFDQQRFKEGLKKVRVSVSFNPKMDETTELCRYVVPDHHYLESWGDAEARTGQFSLIQPTINPLFKTRQWQDSLLKWSASPTDYLTFVRTTWIGRLGSEANWDKALQDGVITPGGSAPSIAAALNAGTQLPNQTGGVHGTSGPSADSTRTNTVAATTVAGATAHTATSTGTTSGFFATGSGGQSASFNTGGLAAAAAAIAAAPKAGVTELVIYQKVTIGDGSQANNPWLQEAPDPITKATWDNYAIISPAMAKAKFGIDLTNNGDTDAYEVHPEKQQLKITVNNASIELPIIIVPGTNPDTIAVALGYGRNEKLGKASKDAGKNAYPLVAFNGNTRDYVVRNVTVERGSGTHKVAQTQVSNSYSGRTEVVLETTLATLKQEPKFFSERREELHKDYAPQTGNYEKDATLYPIYDRPGIRWGMSIDMNSCIGCQACVVACNAENNIAVVGKTEVARYHDMHWMRIDRYFSGDINNPTVVFQPMLCQHCDNAPCENVCPVAATNHSSEGLNQMAYNRCIGTRYCANNCPYKVRRFNWADYMGADSFPNNQEGTSSITDAAMHMNDDLTRMVLNPDVTVRSRGVIEKCTFCVQRLQDGKLKAKKESRPINTGANNNWDVKVACQQSCPTDAIVFGNVNDKTSPVYNNRMDNQGRLFYVLEMIHTLPNVSYLAKVRNTDEIVHVVNEHETAGGTEGKVMEHQEGQAEGSKKEVETTH
jgi:MoCo/4Fe-4S cofactor protein with predicted Tat translocation signal